MRKKALFGVSKFCKVGGHRSVWLSFVSVVTSHVPSTEVAFVG